MRKYSDEVKLAAVRDYCSGSGGLRLIAERYQVDLTCLRQWIAGYQARGEEGVKSKKRAMRSYSAEFKLSVLARMREERLSGREAAALFNIRRAAVISEWATSYRNGGVEALGSVKAMLPQDMASLGAFILPKDYFEKVGLDGFLAKPIGSGPYRLSSYARDSRIVLEAVDKHWRGPAKIRHMAWQVVKNPTARSAALQSGQVGLVTDLPVRETLRLATLSGDKSAVTPTPDMYIVQMTNLGPLKQKAVRLAMHMAIDKAAISRAFFNNVATPLSAPAAPGTPAFQADFTFPFSVAQASAQLATVGVSPAKPIAFKFYATNGVYPNDYDVARAIVQMWQKVGINATLQVIELAEYFSRAGAGTLDGPVLWFWSNATGDPAKGLGTFLNPKKVFSVWKSQDISDRLEPLLVETDYDKRIAGFKAFDVWAVQQGYTLPLLQGVATVAYKKSVPYKPFSSGQILPYYWSA